MNSVSFGGQTYPIDGTVTSASVDRVRDQPQSKDVQKVAIGAVAGAIAGKILGKTTKGAVIGGAAGAAAGAAAAVGDGQLSGLHQLRLEHHGQAQLGRDSSRIVKFRCGKSAASPDSVGPLSFAWYRSRRRS